MHAVQSTRKPIATHYPNAASRRYYLEKTADAILSAAICVGVVAILFFVFTVF